MSELTEEEKRVEAEVQAALVKLQQDATRTEVLVEGYWSKYGVDVIVGVVLFCLGIALGHFTA